VTPSAAGVPSSHRRLPGRGSAACGTADEPGGYPNARANHSVANGDAVVSPRITRRLLDVYATQLPDPSAGTTGRGQAALDQLTPREREVLRAVAAGLSNTEIADQLVVSDATVKTHVGNVLAKLNLRNRVQAVIFAYDIGLVR
jgi:DNA-binding NarL/FixJ family response regulator